MIKPAMASTMIPMKIPVRLTKKNGYYGMTEEQNHQLDAAVEELENVTNFNKETGTVEYTAVGKSDSSFAKITKALMSIERAKIELFVRLANEYLHSNPKMKVVLCFNYTSTIDCVQHKLKDYELLS